MLRRWIYAGIPFFLIMTLFVSCKKVKVLDITAFTQYLSEDKQSVLDQIEESGYVLKEQTDDEWVVEDLPYEDIHVNVIFSFSDRLMAYTVEYDGQNTEKGKAAATSMFDTLKKQYGTPYYPAEENEDEWDALWASGITSASGMDEYGGYRMVEYRWENQHCVFRVKLYGEDGSDGLRIRCRYYQEDAWNAMYKK